MNRLTRRTFNKTIERISALYRAGKEGSPEYRHLIDLAWATAPDDVSRLWMNRADELGFLVAGSFAADSRKESVGIH